jgi:glutaredoxin-related protein
MKNLLIVFLLVVILVLASFLYKNSMTSIYRNFPMVEVRAEGDEVHFFLYVFFSKHNCKDCLEVIDSLNTLRSHFKVIGVVPDSELKNEMELRSQTGAEFQLIRNNEYRKYITPYTPSVLGASKRGRIFFILPAVPKLKEFLEFYLDAFYQKTFPYL